MTKPTKAKAVKPVRAYAYWSPVFGAISTYGMSQHPSLVRKAVVRVGTVHGGKEPGEDWAYCRKKGYRVIPVLVTPIAPKRAKEKR